MSQTIRSFSLPAPVAAQGVVAAVLAWVRRVRLTAQTRRALAAMDERTLRDLGLSRAQARFMTETDVLVPGNLR